MRVFTLFLLFTIALSTASAQTRQQAIEEFNSLKKQAENLERKILLPDKEDIEAGRQENANVIRILPREIYDKGFFSIRGGGSYYSFYFRIPDWGHGSDIGLEQNYFSAGFTGLGLMADLGEISLNEISKSSSSINSLINYQNIKFEDHSRDFYMLRGSGLKLDDTIFKSRLPVNIGHTYIVRSTNYDWYDILVAFRVHRKDSDGSLIIFWKQIELFDTPKRRGLGKVQLSDADILKNTKSWSQDKLFPNVQAEVYNGVLTLRGTIPKEKLAYAIQLANDTGAVKVINLLAVN